MVWPNWFNYAEIVSVLLVSVAYVLWRPFKLSEDAFFSQQRWTIIEVAAFFIILDVIGALMHSFTDDLNLSFLMRLCVWVLLNLFGLWGFFAYVKQPLSAIGLSRHRSSYLILLGLKVVLYGLLVIWIMAAFLPVTRVSPTFEESHGSKYYSSFQGTDLNQAVPMFLIQLLCVAGLGSLEEIKYRGLLYSSLRKKLGSRPAIVVNALCFMTAHGTPNLVLFVIGCMSAWLLEKYRSVIPGIVVHLVWNIAMYVAGWFISVLKVSPNTFYQYAAMTICAVLVVAHGFSAYISSKSSIKSHD